MNGLLRAAAEVQEFCLGHGWRFCFIGGLAVQRWGEPRVTRDVDLTIMTGFGGEATFVDLLLEHFPARVDDAREFALRSRVLLARSAEGVPVDIALGALPFEGRVVSRATPYAYAPGIDLLTCSAEDLVVLKAFAGRERDWLDIEGIVVRQGDRLSTQLVWHELQPLLELKEAPEHAERLRALVDEARRSG